MSKLPISFSMWLSLNQKEKIEELIQKYKRIGIYIDVLSCESREVKIRVEQKKYINDKILTDKDLVDRAKEVFKDKIPEDLKLLISPIFTNRTELSAIDAAFVLGRMEELGLNSSHLCKYLDIDKSSMSRILTEGRELTKWQKAAFYYFFKQFNLKMAVNNR